MVKTLLIAQSLEATWFLLSTQHSAVSTQQLALRYRCLVHAIIDTQPPEFVSYSSLLGSNTVDLYRRQQFLKNSNYVQ